MPPVTDPKKLTGNWKSLYNWLMQDPKCKCCTKADLEKEALAIVNGAMAAKAKMKGKGRGCITCSTQAIFSIDARLRALYGAGSPKVKWKSDRVKGITRPGIDWIAQKLTGRTAMRTAMRTETPCYIIENVAWWVMPPNTYSGIFAYRHQAILVYPKCRSDTASLAWGEATVIDVYDGMPVWNSWKGWIPGGMKNLNKRAGRVRDTW